MAFDYDVVAGRGFVVIRPRTPPTLQDWIDVLDALAADSRVEPQFGILSDRRHLTTAPDADYVRGSIQALAERDAFASRRIAILTHHAASFGMARMAEAYAEPRGLQFRVFIDYEEAVQWVTGGTE